MEFEMIAKTFQGLEGVLAEELRQIGATNVEEGRRMVSFTGDKAVLYKANFCCRTALRILKPIYKFLASDADGNPVKGVPRHPIVGDNVIIYSNSSILGRIRIGDNAVIGGNMWVTSDVPDGEMIVQHH